MQAPKNTGTGTCPSTLRATGDLHGGPEAGVIPIDRTGFMPYLAAMNLNYLIGLLWFIFWVVALVDCIKGNSPNKLLWVVLIILLPFLGSILYFLLGRGTARL
jgi:hypothetical protein